MNDEQINNYFQAIQRHLNALAREDTVAWRELGSLLEDLQGMYEQMQTGLETIEGDVEELFQEKQHYYDVFQSAPIPYLLTDALGVILEINQAAADLFNMAQARLVGKPLAVFVSKSDRGNFRTQLNRLSQSRGTQIWRVNLCPGEAEPVAVELHIAACRNPQGWVESLRVGIYALNQSQQMPAGFSNVSLPSTAPEGLTERPADRQVLNQSQESRRLNLQLAQPSHELRVLVVDDEADVREFVTVILESFGIVTRAVASAAEALEALEQFHPDVLVSDLRMPDGDGYSLIRQVRALEKTLQGRHLPAAAITAYLEEDRDKALNAGFEAHLHKLAEPIEWIELVTQLAGNSLD